MTYFTSHQRFQYLFYCTNWINTTEAHWKEWSGLRDHTPTTFACAKRHVYSLVGCYGKPANTEKMTSSVSVPQCKQAKVARNNRLIILFRWIWELVSFHTSEFDLHCTVATNHTVTPCLYYVLNETSCRNSHTYPSNSHLMSSVRVCVCVFLQQNKT